MRICVLQFSSNSSGSSHEDLDSTISGPGPFASQHTLEHRFICKETAREQIDAIVDEGFDFYINCLWGASEEPESGIQSSQYLESLEVPSAGVRSWAQCWTNDSFYRQARQRGAPNVPGTAGFPGSTNQTIKENSEDYTVAVIELGNSAIGLNPCVAKSTGLFKPDSEARNKLIRREDNAALFQRLQHAALEAFEAGMFRGSHTGCEVDIRVYGDEVFVLSAHPLPMAFLRERNFQNLPALESFPGGPSAMITVFIANYNCHCQDIRREPSKIAAAYDEVAPEYDTQGQSNSQDEENFRQIIETYDFEGTVADLACGTGFFGRVLKEHGRGSWHLVGFDISPGMVNICRKTGLYDQVYIAGMQTCLLQYFGRGGIDNIVCFGAVHFLTPEEFAFFLVQGFMIANKSMTIAVDEIPDSYNEHLHQRGMSHMHSINHLAIMESFGEPQGWRLVSRQRQYSWKSPTTGDDIYSTFFRFERDDQRNIQVSMAAENT